MSTDMLTAVMKTIGSTADKKTRTLIDGALDKLNQTASEQDAASLNIVMDTFTRAKAAHTETMLKLNDIGTAITRSGQERQNALDESAEAEQSWRTRFRALRGVMTPEMKVEHRQRTASRELAEEFTALIDELEDDKSRTMLTACTTGQAYVNAHLGAFTVLARNEWAAVMKDLSPALVRAFTLRLRELEMSGTENAAGVLFSELGAQMLTQSRFYLFDMDREPVLSQLGLHRPALTGVDMSLYRSPVRRMALGKTLAEKKEAREVKS